MIDKIIEKLNWQIIVKNLLKWETILFVFANLIILTNIFPLIATYLAYMGYSYIDWLYKAQIEGISVILMLAVYLMPLLIIIKYLLLPLTIFIILRQSKNVEIITWIRLIFQNSNLQLRIVLFAIIVDIFAIISSYFARTFVEHSYFYSDSDLFWRLVFGGLTGSYLAIFIFLFLFRKIKSYLMLLKKM